MKSTNFVLLLLLSGAVHAKTLELSPQKLIDLSLQSSDQVQKLITKRQTEDIELVREKVNFDYLVSFNPYYNITEAESLDGFANEKDKRLGYSLSIEKKTTFGSHIKLAYEKLGVNTEFNTFNLTRNIPETQYKDMLSFEWEQSLYYNAFGKADQLTLESAEKQQQYFDHSQLESIENEILDSMSLYWDAYTAKQNFEETLASRKRYEDLLKTVNRKSRLGYTAPGELARTKAELEAQKQRVKLASQTYLHLLARLKQHLNLSQEIEIDFKLDNEIPNLPKVKEKSINDLRELKKVEINQAQAQNAIAIADSKSRPEWNLLAKVQSTGVEATGEDSFEELAKFTKPTYYLGMRVRFHFGSGAYGAESVNARLQKKLADLGEKITRDKIVLQMENQINLVKASYMIAKSSLEVLKFRNAAMKQIKRAYTQGRVDIQELINAYNAQNLAATQKIQAIGEYHMNLNRMAALRDELVVQ